MRISKYVAPYLAQNASLGEGKGYTIGTYLAYRLRGAQKSYSGRYKAAIENGLAKVGAVEGRSCRGGVAYYPKPGGTL